MNRFGRFVWRGKSAEAAVSVWLEIESRLGLVSSVCKLQYE
jgi:hypothetical protein